MFYTYILKSLKDNSYYYGSTSNLEVRLKDHNAGRSKYSKSKRPWIIHHFEEYATKNEALKRELFFKSIDGYKWLKRERII